MTEAALTTADAGSAGDDRKAEHLAKLARMAGQIADFFKAYPDAEAVPAVADHINQFWTGGMRDAFIDAYSARPEDLPPLLRRALPLIRPARGS
ncbi:formate dehydrogenase subunit delta [Bosea minatitlanensis]|uniref:Formate dehydrogenase subunit delta n=1 Tax=Bosea minatitlanensis TaxID=128782 RepID=A0ABW0F597_9HYPH|nr:formate dehydrogenase subunit delta [Bosea minatitlanensis]MCT4494372.1 formate dehydrogenase subunit delta [Bosea minatitlanensis]